MPLRSIRAKALLVLLPVMTAIVLLLATIGYLSGRQIINQEVSDLAVSEIDKIAYHSGAQLREQARAVNDLARMIETAGFPKEKAWYVRVLHQTLADNPKSFAFGVWYEPFWHDPTRRYYGLYNYRKQGRIIYTDAYNAPSYDYHHWQWYTIARPSTGAVVWSMGYFDPPVRVDMVTATAPLRTPAGRFIGVVTGDIALDELQNLVSETRIGKAGRALLLDSFGRYIVALHPAQTRTPIDEDPNPSLAALGRRVMSRDHGVDSYQDAQGSVHVYFRRVPETQWLVAVAIPDSDLYRPLHQWLAWSALVAVVGVLAAAIGAFWLSDNLTAPIRQLVSAARRLGEGEHVDVNVDQHACDEIDVLVSAFNTMASRLQAKTDALESERQRLNLIFLSLAEGLLMVDRQGRIVDANPSAERLLRLPKAGMVGMPYDELLRLTGADATVKTIDRMSNLEWPGQPLTVIKLSQVPLNHNGSVVSFRDVTHEEAVNRLKSEFVSMASHELRTPMTIAKGYLGLLMMVGGPILEPQRRSEMLRSVDNQMDRLIHIVDDLLSVSQIEQGRMPWHPEVLDVAPLVAAICQIMAPLAENRRIQILLPETETLPVVFADKEQITRILTNLLDNAIKYSPPDSRIVVSRVGLGDWIRVTVTDQGVGIAPEELGRLFEKFHRIAGNPTLKTRGTGLGLYIARSLADLQNGLLVACSTLGAGSSFSLMLPTATHTAGPPSAPTEIT